MMQSIRRVVNDVMQLAASLNEHIHMARAYRPVSNKMMPRWRVLGRSVTPYQFMRPAYIPVQPQQRRMK